MRKLILKAHGADGVDAAWAFVELTKKKVEYLLSLFDMFHTVKMLNHRLAHIAVLDDSATFFREPHDNDHGWSMGAWYANDDGEGGIVTDTSLDDAAHFLEPFERSDDFDLVDTEDDAIKVFEDSLYFRACEDAIDLEVTTANLTRAELEAYADELGLRGKP